MKKYESKYELRKAGKILYSLTMNWAAFLMKHRVLYYILSFTWGFLMTFISLLAIFVFSIAGIPPKTYYWVWYYQIGSRYWGGLETGIVFFRDTDDVTKDEELNMHEFGHTFQNTLFGPFAIFISFLPSAFRYWYREIKWKIKKETNPKKYDAIWFEASATDAGKMAVEYFKSLEQGE